MQNPFETLGISPDASTEQVRAAYHAKVKRCHPDLTHEAGAAQRAQEALVRVNLAYTEALRLIGEHQGSIIMDAVQVARKLYEQDHYDGALRMLERAPARDAEWCHLKGTVLMRKGEAEAAHICFRAAVKAEPENAEYRKDALEAAVLMRKQKTIRGRMACWARGLVGLR